MIKPLSHYWITLTTLLALLLSSISYADNLPHYRSNLDPVSCHENIDAHHSMETTHNEHSYVPLLLATTQNTDCSLAGDNEQQHCASCSVALGFIPSIIQVYASSYRALTYFNYQQKWSHSQPEKRLRPPIFSMI